MRLFDDARLGLRMMRQRPLFALVATVSIAIGVGATTTIFSVFNALLFRTPPGVAEPERVVELGRTNGGRGFDTFGYPEFVAIQEQSKLLSAVAGWRITPLSFAESRESERIMGMAASGSYFQIFGLRPAFGRFFTPEEDRVPGANPVVVLSYQFWQDRFSGDRAVLGRTIDINRRQFTVIGVAPTEFLGHMPVVRPDVYFPLTMFGITRPGFNSWQERQSSWLTAVGQLRPGVTAAQVNSELKRIFDTFWSGVDVRERRGATALGFGTIPGPGRLPVTAFLSILLGFVGLVLLITCANVAGMLIARAAAREREMAIRLAIGSSRGALISQLIVESLLIFLIGGIGGILIARWSADALASIHIPAPIPLHLDFHADARVLGFGLLLALGTGLLFGLAPALQASNPSVLTALKSESARRSSRGGRVRRKFVMAQVALSLILLSASGLFLRSLQNAAGIDTGFDGNNVYSLALDLSMDGYDEPRGLDFQNRLLARLQMVPGVTAAGFTEDLPLDLGMSGQPTITEGQKEPGRGQETAFSRVGGDFFNALHIPVLRGRVFGPQDVASAPRVAVISRSFAERAWPGQDPLGKRVRFYGEESWMTVVGVVAEVKNKSVMEVTDPMIYVPVMQQYSPSLYLVVRHSGGLQPSAVRAAISEVDPRLSLSLIQRLDEYTSLGILPQRIAAMLSTVLGVLALLLSAMGVYGVIAFTVATRTREIGTRMALGANRGDVTRLIIRDGLRLAAPGLAIGIMCALGLGQLLRSFILGVAPTDVLTFTLAPAALLLIILVACWSPARRAAGLPPVLALKSE
jgi:predicted permease